ncbi:hypothetical protein OIU76_013961 [Salix suchowensis]|nr:hypothetical protein OIU76_013961 [Salix suchowensis]
MISRHCGNSLDWQLNPSMIASILRDWRESPKENMISLRRNGICRNLLKEVIFENVSSKNKLSYAQLGRITLMILGSGEMLCEPYEKKAGGLKWNFIMEGFSLRISVGM